MNDLHVCRGSAEQPASARSGSVATEHLADARRNVMRVRLQREVAAIQHLDHRLWIIPLPGHCARWNKERIVLAPDHQRWHLLLAKERLKFRITFQITGVIEKQGLLNIFVTGRSISRVSRV